MLQYSEKYGGYVADNPIIDFERCDGRVFSYDEVNTSGFTNGSESITITGGQGCFPLAILDTTKTQEFTFDISNFTMELFEMTNAVNAANGDYGTLETKRYEVETGLKINLPFEVKTGSVKILGLTEETTDAELAAGKFKVTITAAQENTAGKTEIVLHETDAALGDTVRVSYRRRIVNAQRVTVKTTSKTARGALYAHYPVYSSGMDCTESAIKAWIHIEIPRVRVTALPGFNTTYKQASTFSVTFSGLDPKRPDGQMWAIYFEPTDGENDGEIVAKSANAVNWN